MIKNILLVGLGGGIGSILRYLTSVFIKKAFNGTFPLATFVVNILGCFLVGILFNFVGNTTGNNYPRLLFIVGFCGGFTTFSAFALENINLLQTTNFPIFFLYLSLSILTGFIAVWLGMMIK